MIGWLKALFVTRRLRKADLSTLDRWAEIYPPITDWDVAQAPEQSEPRCVEYKFLGVTGEEES
jgi:hypothetical protein